MSEPAEIPVAYPAAELPTTPSGAGKATTIVSNVLPLLAVAVIPRGSACNAFASFGT